jgi:hypothetical protein
MIKVTNTTTDQFLTLDKGVFDGPEKFVNRAKRLSEQRITILHPDYREGMLTLDPNGSLEEKVALMRVALDPYSPWKTNLMNEYDGEDLLEFQTGQKPGNPKTFQTVKPVRKSRTSA